MSTFISSGVSSKDLQIVTSTLYHADLLSIMENTLLSGDTGPCPLYMLRYHQDRMLAAISDLTTATQVMYDAITGAKGLESMRKLATLNVLDGPSKLRFSLDCDGRLTCTAMHLGNDVLLKDSVFFPTILPHPDSILEDDIRWMVGVSRHEIQPNFTTKHKTNLRMQYVKAMESVPHVDPVKHKLEVLCVNNEQQIMEGCITTPYFWNNGKWVTPSAECGGNLGTTRRWALEKGLVTEGIIMRSDLVAGQKIVLSNGVWGFGFGKIMVV